MAQLKATGITGSLEVINEYITGSITGSDAKFTSITGTLQGNAATATTAVTATTANAVENEITFNNSGTGDASGTTYDGTSEATISYNTVGAPKSDGTGASGTWGISITGNAATVTNGVTTSNISSYATTAVTAGTGLSGGGTVGALTLDLDFSELTDKTSDIAGTTEFILQDGTTESRKAASEIKLSFFNNDSGWTSNTGDITSVVAGNGLTGGATSGDATLTVGAGTGITVNASDVAINTSVVPTLSATNTFTSRNTFANITVDTTLLKSDSSNDVVEVGDASTSSGSPATLRIKCGTDRNDGLHLYRYDSTGNQWYVWQDLSNNLFFEHYQTTGTKAIHFTQNADIHLSGNIVGSATSTFNGASSKVNIGLDNFTNDTGYIPMSLGTYSGNAELTVDGALYFNPSTNILISPTFAGNLAWSYITSTPTTVSGYGITDAVGTGANNTFTADNTFNNDVTIGSNSFGNGVSSTSHVYNVGIGYQALNAANSSQYSVGIGYRALYSATSANYSTAIGSYSMINTSIGMYNTAVGYQTLYSNDTGYRNTVVGQLACYRPTASDNNVVMGYYAMYGAVGSTTPYRNVALGTETLYSISTGNYNIAIGYQAGRTLSTGYRNVFMGGNAGYYGTTLDNNVAIGYFALNGGSTATGMSRNVAIGTETIDDGTTAGYNVAIGYQAGTNMTSATYNTVVGYTAGSGLTTSFYNTLIGRQAGSSITTGVGNTILGSYTGTTSLTQNVVLSDGYANVRMTIDSSGDAVINGSMKAYTDGNSSTGIILELDDPGAGAYDGAYWNQMMSTSNGRMYFQYNGSSLGYLSPAGSNTQLNFTGQHRNIPSTNIEDYQDKEGLIVVSVGAYSNGIAINEALPNVELSSARNQKSAFGVVSSTEDAEENTREYSNGIFVSVFEKPENDNRLIINSVGEGGIWVCNINGNLENGDYITTCEVPGFGMKQDDDLLHNYTVAKITCDCDFDLASTNYVCEEFEHNGVTYKKAFVGCTYHCG
jgi:hypothetical protein